MAVIGLAVTSCQKDNIVIPEATVTEMSVGYSVGGNYGNVSLSNDAEWETFLNRMLALAREGYEVTIFSDNSNTSSSAKEVVTFTTTLSDEATHWAKNMVEQGYSVTIVYDDKTGIYTCTAVK